MSTSGKGQSDKRLGHIGMLANYGLRNMFILGFADYSFCSSFSSSIATSCFYSAVMSFLSLEI